MDTKFKNQLFEIVKDNDGNLKLFEDILEMCYSFEKDIIHTQNEVFRDTVIRPLIFSENNFGWEDRHSDRISLLHKAIDDFAYE